MRTCGGLHVQVLQRWEQPEVMTLKCPLPVTDLMLAALDLEEAAGQWQVMATGHTSYAWSMSEKSAVLGQ